MLEIRKPDILQRLTKRLGIKPPAGGPIGWLSNIVILVSSVDELLKLPALSMDTMAVASTGVKYGAAIPKGKRRLYYNFNLQKISGAFTYTSIGIETPGGNRIALSAFASSSALVMLNFPQPILVDENWKPYINIDGYTSAGDALLTILYLEEDAF